MGSDMVAALARATTDRRSLFGHNSLRPAAEVQVVISKPGRSFVPGEMLALRRTEVPQVRQTLTVLAGRPAGLWGYCHGINEKGLAVGLTHIHTRVRSEKPGLDGHELTRLTLERATSARQAVDLIADLVARHGQGAAAGEPDDLDCAFLVVDGQEAFVLEMAGQHWAEQEVKEVRAVTGLCQLRQDWDRISPGLADYVISQGWWAEDGSKVDFAGTVGLPSEDGAAYLRRWGRATLWLEEQNGRIDMPFLKRLLGSSVEGLCHAAPESEGVGTASSFLADVGCAEGEVSVAWCSLGPPSLGVYFPLSLDGEVPGAFKDPGQAGVWRRLRRLQIGPTQLVPGARNILAGLQGRFDNLAGEFKLEAAEHKRRGERSALKRLADSFMESALERFEETCDGLVTGITSAMAR